MGHRHLESDIEQRTLNVCDQTCMEDVGNNDADCNPSHGVKESCAELGEMLHQAHARKFGAVGDGFARPVDRVKISHAGWPRWLQLRPQLLRDRGRVGSNREQG